jgi:hypothetical protein
MHGYLCTHPVNHQQSGRFRSCTTRRVSGVHPVYVTNANCDMEHCGAGAEGPRAARQPTRSVCARVFMRDNTKCTESIAFRAAKARLFAANAAG